MATDKVEKILEDSQKLLMKHFPFKGQLDLVVLKGHLLIEQLLWKFVENRVLYPEALKELQKPDRFFSFNTLVCFAQSLDENKDFAWVWEAIKKLNVIRNSLAHRTEYLSRFKGKPGSVESKDYEMQLKVSIMAILSVLGALLKKEGGD